MLDDTVEAVHLEHKSLLDVGFVSLTSQLAFQHTAVLSALQLTVLVQFAQLQVYVLVFVVTHADFVHLEQRSLDGAELTVVQSAFQHAAVL